MGNCLNAISGCWPVAARVKFMVMNRTESIDALKELIRDNEAVLDRVRLGVANLENKGDTEIITRATAFSEKLLNQSSHNLETAGDILFDSTAEQD